MANIAESPRIFRGTKRVDTQSNLRVQDNQLLIDSSSVIEGARLGPYDIVMDFGTSRDRLRGLVPEDQRLIATNNDNLTVIGFEDPDIRLAMGAITDLANDLNKSSENPEDRRAYRKALREVYEAMADEATTWDVLGDEAPLVFAPKNGGIFVQEVFEESGFPRDNFFDYRMSRVQGNDGGLMVGTTLGKDNPEISEYRRFVFADDCMASDISAFATMEMIREALVTAGVPLSEAEILITVSVATQRGLESLLSQKTKEYFGFGSIKAVVGTLAYQMNDHFYLQHPDERYAVGDMGNWSQPPTE